MCMHVCTVPVTDSISVCLRVGIDWVPLPLDPDIRLTGLVASTASMFASAVYPCVIEFKEKIAEDIDANQEEGSVPTLKKAPSHKIMFKSGDDLRQDQLIMQVHRKEVS